MIGDMKAFIFDPLWSELATQELQNKLQAANIEAIVTKEVAPLADCTALYEGDEERLLCVNPDYVNWKLSSDDYKSIPNLKGILGAATSFSWIDMSYANANNIPVCNIRGFSSEAVAEWATMMMLNVARQTPRLIKDGFPLDFDKDYMKYRGVEVHGKTAGIIGLGNIGTAIAQRCAGLGMRVIYWSQHSRSKEYEYKELASLMSQADVIFPVLAVNDETKQLITPEMLDSIKPSAMVIDIVNELIEHEPLAKKVRSGELYGLGFEAKPGAFNEYEGNVWAAPAYGWVTDSSMYGTEEKWVENMVNATQNKFPNRVN
jgi:lactate dehydrogenase-like 2-hydroxyacid dehydrogenase